MILTQKPLLVDIFLTRRLSKQLAFCKFARVDFEPRIIRHLSHSPSFLGQNFSSPGLFLSDPVIPINNEPSLNKK